VAENVYRLEVGALDLGPEVKAIGLELIDPQTREPVTGSDAAGIWSALLLALAVGEPWAIDFYSHVERVREFCLLHRIGFREPNARTIIISEIPQEQLQVLLERFAGETFGMRAGSLLVSGDPAVEGELAARGIDAYHAAFPRYAFCAVCDFEAGFLTVLSNSLWASEVIRRAQTVLASLSVEIARPASV
jgi:hypothetical protein